MKALKIVCVLLLSYVGLVVVFESMLGFFQPKNQETFLITTTSADGVSAARVLTRNYSNGKLYAAANHWPRAWYNQALENPQIEVTLDGVTADYVAVPLSDVEHEQVRSENANGVGLHFLFGFAPRKFLRLDPVI